MPQQPGQIANVVPRRADPGALMRMIVALQQDVQALQGALVVNGLTVNGTPGVIIQNGGRLTLVDPASGRTVAYLGQSTIPDGSGRVQMIATFFRDDGSPALELGDFGTTPGHTHQQALQWYDRNSNVVFSDDTVSGTGIARPHLMLTQLVDTNTSRWPSTSSTSLTVIAAGWAEIQHPKIQYEIQTFAPAGVTGQWRLIVGGTQVGATATLAGGGSGQFGALASTELVPAGIAFGSIVLIQLQAQVTVGSGSILGSQLQLTGVQS